MPINKAEAIVLNRYDFRETSFIVNFYTREFGRLKGILKGIRKDPVKFASTLELFSCNDIIFYKHRSSELHLVSQAEIKDNFNCIRKNITRTALASLMIELLGAVMPLEEKNEDVFTLSLATLKELEINEYPEKMMTIYKIKMLDLSGFKPHFDSCINCQAKIIGDSKFSLSLGGLLCSGCLRKDHAARSIYRGTIATILHIQRNDFKNNLNLGLNPQIKKELDILLNSFLNFHLEKEFKAQKVFNKLITQNDARRVK